ncbi:MULTISPECIES: RHS repeat-associated core domain-containing protein [unclassified Flavobacterium]|uniref:RHS repeat-associated core domain-containing protein n=1 Tax=unclassified Flavobacterium TaxID=196869 RepID=UPI001F141FC1|nr:MULTISPECIES: RHS repeat-associated core domain-containing protein [unclassified Flavobacterium]UMY66009.1 hypothetical protein MKO97_01115 [Flavobacterium sp. HJ-32-4]
MKHTESAFNYVYNYTDHLGNNRLSYTWDKSTQALTIMEENNYYPFGLKHENYNTDKVDYDRDETGGNLIVLAPVVRLGYQYKYNGKEFQDELGLNFYDYGARNYDAALGRWMNMDPLAETSRRWTPYNYCYNGPLRFVDPDGMRAHPYADNMTRLEIIASKNRGDGFGDDDQKVGEGDNDDRIEYKTNDGKQSITYDPEVKTVEQANAKGYTDVKRVVSDASATNKLNGDKIQLQADGNYTVNGSAPINPAEQPYMVNGYATINANQSALSQLAPLFSNSGDAAVVMGSLLVLSGVGAPLGVGLITIGGYVSTTGTVMDLADDANKGTLTAEKVITKIAVQVIPLRCNAAFKSLGAPAAGELFNLGTMGTDHLLDEMRSAKAGPYRD